MSSLDIELFGPDDDGGDEPPEIGECESCHQTRELVGEIIGEVKGRDTGMVYHREAMDVCEECLQKAEAEMVKQLRGER